MYGVIDIGSNTIRLVIYKVDESKIVAMLNKKVAVGLVGYIDKNNCMKKKGMHVAVQALKEFEEIISYMSIEEIFPFATASIRNIENCQEVIDYIREHTKFDAKVLSGNEEATFDYFGAIQSVNMDSGLLVDVGGGSTELVFYQNKKIVSTHSLPIGSLNLYREFVKGICPTKSEIEAIRQKVIKELNCVNIESESICAQPLCAVGGTARAIYKLLLHKGKLDADSPEYACRNLSKLLRGATENPDRLSRLILKISPDRIHTFIPGLILFHTIANHYESETIITSQHGVREGYLHFLLQERGELYGE